MRKCHATEPLGSQISVWDFDHVLYLKPNGRSEIYGFIRTGKHGAEFSRNTQKKKKEEVATMRRVRERGHWQRRMACAFRF